MREFLVAILTAGAASLYLAGCTTTPTEEQKPAPTEERKPVEGAATPRGVAPAR